MTKTTANSKILFFLFVCLFLFGGDFQGTVSPLSILFCQHVLILIHSELIPEHISCPSAIRMPIEKLVPLCKEFGVMCVVDGAHGPGQFNLNIRELDPDFYLGKIIFDRHAVFS